MSSVFGYICIFMVRNKKSKGKNPTRGTTYYPFVFGSRVWNSERIFMKKVRIGYEENNSNGSCRYVDLFTG
ncbi:MAG: hypothetical protein ABS897_11120, partial [Eubacteriales bacterium]